MQIIGIDISKAWFACFCSASSQSKQFINTAEGWEQFIRWAPDGVHVVMEASGPYYLGLASWLVQQGYTVSVVNPLVIRRYGQMKLARVKTDPKDAELIAGYGIEQTPEPWTPPSGVCQALRQLLSLHEGLLRQQSIIVGQTEAFSQAPADALVMELLAEQKAHIRTALDRLDQRLELLARKHYAKTRQALLTIPGIGPKTAIMLLAITDGFARFDSARKLASYVGISRGCGSQGALLKVGEVYASGLPAVAEVAVYVFVDGKNL